MKIAIRTIATLAMVPLAALLIGAQDDRPPQADGLPLVLKFDPPARGLDAWEFTDPRAWKLAERDGRTVLDQFQGSRYGPKVRSPFNIALARGVDVADCVIDFRVQSTVPDYKHRDVCIFFSHQDATHFYYAHIASAADDQGHAIFLVNGKDRTPLAGKRSEGVAWTDGWHHVRLVRKGDLAEVYFDDMTRPIISARDATFSHGRIGIGTFDDTARFDGIRAWGSKP
ncbi:MAG: hypothetical protein U0800_19850 [Isosphaeraceae bacterium]